MLPRRSVDWNPWAFNGISMIAIASFLSARLRRAWYSKTARVSELMSLRREYTVPSMPGSRDRLTLEVDWATDMPTAFCCESSRDGRNVCSLLCTWEQSSDYMLLEWQKQWSWFIREWLICKGVTHKGVAKWLERTFRWLLFQHFREESE